MEYVKKYFELKKRFVQTDSRLVIDDGMEVFNMPFNSEDHWRRIMDESDMERESLLALGMPDSYFFDNNHFTYPVFVPGSSRRYNKAIILLHGLNERFWDKYLPWAYFLAKKTQRPVILFPISFHMNRSPEGWNNPKVMAPLVNYRRQKFDTSTLTFANAALSIRLTEDPLRFLKSGHQTTGDLIQLINQMRQGLIPIFEKDVSVDIFAYSIGVFVAQIMLMAYPQSVFSNSKFFFFCGGAFFNDMRGESKLIMDRLAYERLNQFYTTDMDNVLKEKKLLAALLAEFPLGRAFYSMLSEKNTPHLRDEQLNKIENDIYTIALEKDKVIPASGINKFLNHTPKKLATFEVLDFPYDYSHEVPFPVSGKADPHQINTGFNHVFSKAIEFFA